MKTVQIKLYKFSELSTEAQNRAVREFRSKLPFPSGDDVMEGLIKFFPHEVFLPDGSYLLEHVTEADILNMHDYSEKDEPEFDNCDDCGTEVNLKRGEDFFVEIPRYGSKMVCEKCYLEKYQQYYSK